MKLSYVAFVASFALAAPLLAQQPPQDRPQPPRAQPPATAPSAAPPVETPAAQPPSPEVVEAQRRRDEQSIDLEVLIARVAERTGKQFIVDPRVRGRVYSVPQIEEPTYAELLTILRVHGYAASDVGGRVSVVPDANARFLPVRLLNRDDDNVPDDEFVTRVITVPNAASLVPVLRPLMPQAAHLAAVLDESGTESSKLILMDTYANVRRMTELIDALRR